MPMSYKKIDSMSLLPAYSGLLTGVRGGNALFTLPDDLIDHIAIIIMEQSWGNPYLTLEDLKTRSKPIEVVLLVSVVAYRSKRRINTILARFRENEYRNLIIINQAVSPVPLIKALYDRQNKNIPAVKEDLSEFESLFDQIGRDAIATDASDIHILVSNKGTTIEMRINGRLRPYSELSKDDGFSLCRAVYTSLADAESRGDPFNERDTQNAVIERVYSTGRVRYRYASAPESNGFVVVLRLLKISASDDDDHILSFTDLGYHKTHTDLIQSGFAKPEGIVIIAGTTGSGKSTTLLHAIKSVIQSRSGYSVYTIEEPIEYAINGARQIPVVRGKKDTGNDNPFVKTIRAVMRLDPEMIMIGEIRDKETAKLAESAAQSGHKVATTLHAASGIDIINRLSSQSLQMSHDSLGSLNFINTLIFQKLMPVLCKNCKEEIDVKSLCVSPNEFIANKGKRWLSIYAGHTIYKSHDEGCDQCSQSGISGRTVCAEVINPDYKMLSYFRKNELHLAFDYWRTLSTGDDDFNGKSAYEHGVLKVKQGLISPFDLELELGVGEVTKKEESS